MELLGTTETLIVTAVVVLLGWVCWRLLSGTRKDGAAVRGEWRVTALNVYPIKSCAGISVQEASLDAHGFELDRRWMIVSAGDKAPTNFFLTQRVCPALALVKPRLTATALLVDAPGMPTLRVYDLISTGFRWNVNLHLQVDLKAQVHVERMEKMKAELGIHHPPEVSRYFNDDQNRLRQKLHLHCIF